MVPDGAAEHGKAGLEGIEDRPHGNRAFYFELDLARYTGEGSKVEGEDDADHRIQLFLAYHASVCTSTDSTGGRSRTIGCQLSPESGEQ